MKIKFYIDGQKLAIKSEPYIVEGSKNYLKSHFYFSGEWCSLTKTAVFSTPDKEKVYHVLLDENECLVPHEVIKEGGFIVSVFAGDVLNTNEVTVHVDDSGFIPGMSPPEPTPDVYTEIIGKFDANSNAIENIKSFAESTNASVAKESEARENADAALQSKIASETTERQNADTALQSKITSETTSRQNADAALQKNIDGKAPTNHVSTAEIYGTANKSYYGHVRLSDTADSTADASSGIAATPKAIKLEATQRANADTALSERIDTLKNEAITANQFSGLREELYGRVHETATVNVTARTSPYGVHGENIYGEVTSVTSDDPNSPYYHVKFYIESTDLLGIISVNGVPITKIDKSLENPNHPSTIYVDDPYWESGGYTLCVTVDPKTQTIIDVIWQKHDDHTINDMCFTEIDGERYITLEVGQIVFDGLENGVGVPVTGDFDLSATWERQSECTDETGVVGTLGCLPTEDKSSLTAAIMEINKRFDAMQSTLGDMENTLDEINGVTA